jgi:hypothetical protein
MKEKLAKLIEDNPGSSFEIDNDVWYMVDKNGNEIATSKDFGYQTDWYGHSSNYGWGVAEAFLHLLNKKGFNITVSAV